MVVTSNKPELDDADVIAWLQNHCGNDVDEVERLQGGFWSAAYGYSHAGSERVIRFNRSREGFDIDHAAQAFAVSSLPIPRVAEIGEAMGFSYAISERAHGTFLELAESSEHLSDLITDMLSKFRKVPQQSRVVWYDSQESLEWRDYLRSSCAQPDYETHPEFEHARTIYDEAVQRMESLLLLCPERRDLIHGDLLHQNVLVSEDCRELRAIFSWKCSAFGDFLYDVAWLTHWAPWHPGLNQIDIFALTQAADELDDAARMFMPERHHCYELQIAASHISWYIQNADHENLDFLVTSLRRILDRGPLFG